MDDYIDYDKVKNLKCPNCGSYNLEKIEGGYEGCCTDRSRHGESQACALTHHGKKCKACGFAFYYGSEF